MYSLLASLIGLLLVATAPASAAIRIAESTYENGTLTITGQTQPNRTVTLGGKYKTKADGGGHFEFHVHSKPDTCMADIATDDDTYSAIITGCLLGDAAASDNEAAKETAGDR